MFALDTLALSHAVILFAAAAVVIMIAGWRLAGLADCLADATGMGEAIAGALLLGASTSLPGILTSAVTASHGLPDLAYSNAVGGIAAQTFFLAVADICYRKANLEHAAASVSNVMQTALLISLLSIPIVLGGLPAFNIAGVHPGSLLILLVYVYGLRMIHHSKDHATWQPEETPETCIDEPEQENMQVSLSGLWIRFLSMAALIGLAGWVVGKTGVVITEKSGLSGSSVGGVFTAVATSLPELVTVIAAVRLGALTLAVGDIIGGNSFDMLFIAVADAAYRPGSIYHAVGGEITFLLGVAISMNAVLMLGLLRRQKRGVGGIGFESFFLFIIYSLTLVYLFTFQEGI